MDKKQADAINSAVYGAAKNTLDKYAADVRNETREAIAEAIAEGVLAAFKQHEHVYLHLRDN